MKPNPLARPFLKWAGGKRQLLPVLLAHRPKKMGTYYEPFLGGGAVLLALQPAHAIANDSNAELINCYEVVRDNVEDLIAALSDHKARNCEDYYYEIRDWDRDSGYFERSPIERAARIIYLNKTCYNGLFRVNAQGQFNVPFGRYASPAIVNEGVLRAVSRYLSTNDVRFRTVDFAQATHDAQAGDFIYFDPPYDPVSSTASFTAYDMNGFGKDEQRRLKDHIDELTLCGCNVMLSNAYTPFIADLYQAYDCLKVEATRAINSNGKGRGKVNEILVMNYGRYTT
ncbi:MAG TPA: DNA adenine methylase [Ktedonobacterales bacterium]